MGTRHAYGYKRTEASFAHVEGIDRFWFDGPKTERQERMEMLRPTNIRPKTEDDPGDELVVLSKADLGAVGERAQIEAVLEERGATLLVLPPPEPEKGRPGRKPTLGGLNQGQADACARLWADMTVPGPYAHRRIQEIAGQPVTRNQINRFFGVRKEPKWPKVREGYEGVD